MPASSVRNLMTGSGTVSTTSGTKVLTFSAAQSFKEGTTIIVDPSGTPQYFTIDTGAGTTWVTMQNSPSTVSGKSFKCSNTVNSRSRGTDGVIVPNAAHFMYRATLDSADAADWYFYVDTLFPENGVHPYTKDQYTGAMMPSSATVQAIVPDPMTRIRLLEGVVRGSSGSATSPDSRLADLVARVYALEQWANGPGHFGTPPAAGTNATFTVEQFLSYGDAQ